MSLNFLHSCTEMEIRPAPGDGKEVLLEMGTSESTSILCRVDTSYDFVIRDATNGRVRCCVSGVEIKGHQLVVYTSRDHPDGIILNNVIYLERDLSVTVPIEKGDGQFTIAGTTTIRVSRGKVNLTWLDEPNLLIKAMSMAFALNLALTDERSVVIDGAIRDTLRRPYDMDRFVNAPVTLIPRNNRLVEPSVFLPNDEKPEEKFWMMAAGWTIRPNKSLALLMEEDSKKVRLYMETSFINNKTGEMLRVLDINGNEEFRAIWSKENCRMKVFMVECQGQVIGLVTFDRDSLSYIVSSYADGTEYSSVYRNHPFTYIDLLRADGASGATFNGQYFPSLFTVLKRGTSPNERKLFICAAFNCFGLYMKNLTNLPIVRLTKLTCNCDLCQQYPDPVGFEYFRNNHHLLGEETLRVRAVGHNKRKNVIYFNVYRSFGGYTGCTLELTPIENFQGVAKIVCKIFTGAVMFTAIHHPQQEVIAVYDYEDQLIFYLHSAGVYDISHRLMMTIHEEEKTRQADPGLFGTNLDYLIMRGYGNCVSQISTVSCCVVLRRPRIKTQRLRRFETFFELIFSIRAHCELFGYQCRPTPEIVYCYFKKKNSFLQDFSGA